jgi:hypothetical protein
MLCKGEMKSHEARSGGVSPVYRSREESIGLGGEQFPIGIMGRHPAVIE